MPFDSNGQAEASGAGRTKSDSKRAELKTTCAADIKPKPIRWLVPQMFPLGKLVLLAGDGGMGKPVITIDLAARPSRGECAFGLKYEAIGGEVLIASCEDDPTDTVVPRLRAAGADVRRVHLLEGVGAEKSERPAPWSLAHYGALEDYLETRPAIRLIIIDPASAFAGRAGIDAHKDAEVRALLGPLTDLAARCNVTILLVAHVGKSEAVKAVRRILNSVAWVNGVRSAWMVCEREEDAGKRLLLPVKGNLAPRRHGLVYSLVPLSSTEKDLALSDIDGLEVEDLERLKEQLFRVAWLGETDADADRVFATAARRPESASDSDKAKEWLKKLLSQGPVPSNSCVEKGNADLGMDRGLKWWRETVLKDRLGGKPRLTRM